MRVLFVTAEVQPLAKTGGLADVSRALPIALTRRGVDVRLLVPGYPGALVRLRNPRIAAKLDPVLGIADALLISGWLPDADVPVWLVDAPSLFCRDGSPYQDGAGQDWADNALRFGFLAHIAAKLAMGELMDWKPDVVHANDWHAGLTPLLLSMRQEERPATVFTAHNLAFQGNFPPETTPTIGIPKRYLASGAIEFYGQASFLKAAIQFSDRVTTVSPTYAKEALSAEFGCGLEGVLRARGEDFSGILNGIDDDLWNPATDIHLPASFGAHDISGKRNCKEKLQYELGLAVSPERPLLAFVSRLAHQKMADVVLDAIPSIVAAGAQFALVAEGDSTLEAAFAEAARRYEGSVAVHIGYEEPLAHRLQAGGDILLAPARFEPCGLTQLYAARYGTVPIVRRTAGLADTVTDACPEAIADRSATGFVFEEPDLSGLLGAIERALALFNRPLTWPRLQQQAMAQDFSWNTSAGEYLELYQAVSGIARNAPLPVSDFSGNIETMHARIA